MDDLISRKAILQALAKYGPRTNATDYDIGWEDAREEITALIIKEASAAPAAAINALDLWPCFSCINRGRRDICNDCIRNRVKIVRAMQIRNDFYKYDPSFKE